MRRRNLVLSGLGAATLFLSSGCDSTVGLDLQANNFREVIVPGACKQTDDLSTVSLSVLLLGGDGQLYPDSRLSGAQGTVGNRLSATESFRFTRAPADSGSMFAEPAVGTGAAGDEQGVGVQPVSLDYEYSGGIDRRNETKLVVLMMDKSGSLIGRDPFTGDVDVSKATDQSQQRLAFFSGLLQNLPENYRVSLVPFSGDFPQITDEYSTPTPNRDVILDGLTVATRASEASGLTPLARSLDSVYTRIIEPNLQGMNPVVVVFTDGLEGVDLAADLQTQATRYADGGLAGASVPIIIVHLQPPPTVDERLRGRDPVLAELACQTGGEYIFLSRADEFTTTSYLQPAVLNRIDGAWKLDVDTTLNSGAFEPGPWLVSTQFTVELAGEERSFVLQRARQRDDLRDSRLWFFKE